MDSLLQRFRIGSSYDADLVWLDDVQKTLKEALKR